MNIQIIQRMLTLISFLLCFKKLSNQNVIGFYRIYESGAYVWRKCDPSCYTCIIGTGTEADVGNQNCLSCDENKGKYFYEEDSNSNCYTEIELSNLLSQQFPSNGKSFFLNRKQNPPKWALCHENCATCSKKPYQISDPTNINQMNCDTCYNDFIKVNSFCYRKITDDPFIGFYKDGITKYCGELYDDKTGKQLGIFEGGNECIIKPDNTYYDQDNKIYYLKNCDVNCGLCISNYCLKCINNFVINNISKQCECPKYLGTETSTSNNCVNCKYSPNGPYNNDGHCVSSKIIDDIDYSIINTTYNIISKCKRPCLTCDVNGRCTSCRSNYYYDSIANSNNEDNIKICLTYKECLDIGIPLKDFNICYNCKVNNDGAFKLPNTNSCISSVDNVNIYYYNKYESYNALVRCHKNCNGCSDSPKGEKKQNCLACLDTANYVYNDITHNCDKKEVEIKEDKCPILLYYIDNLETNINKKKKCIPEGNLCPDGYPYLIQYLNLCVQKCPENNYIEWNEDIPIITYNTPEDKNLILKNILDNTCVLFNNKKEYIRDFWDDFDEIIRNERYNIFDFFNTYYGRNLETYNDGQSLYIFGEDTTLHITKLSLENNYIYKNPKNNNFNYNSNSNYFHDYYYFFNSINYTNRNERRVSIIYLSECEKLIKRLNNIPDSTDLLLLKLDKYRNDTINEIMTNKVQYKIYHPTSSTGDFEFDLEICENHPINIITPTYIYEGSDENIKLLYVLRNVIKEGYEPFILYSNFYTETCEQYSNENNVDMTLKDRRKYIYEKIKNYKFCEKNCYYKSTDENINFINCICKAKKTITPDLEDLSFNTLDEENEKNYLSEKLSKKLNDIEKNKINDYFNFYLVKCYKLFFSKKGFYYNYASLIIITLFILYILIMLFYFCIGFDNYINELKKFLFIKYLGKDSITKIYYTKKIEDNNNNISFDDDLKEKETNLYRKKTVQNRTNSDNIYNRQYKFNVHDPNKWIRENKSSILAHPIKDDQIKIVNDYKYKSNDLYKNANIIQNENNIKINTNNNNKIINNDVNPPKRKNNNYYSMENNNDLINARTVNPITNKNYDNIQDALNWKKINNNIENDNNLNDGNVISSIEEIKNEEINKNNDDINIKNKNKNFNKKSEEHNTSPAIYIYNLILENDIEESRIEEIEEKKTSNFITKREYSFLNDGEINELDYDNAFAHDKRNFIRIYYSFIKYNILLYFSFLVYEDFNVSFAKIGLFINYLILYLTFNAMFFNNNSIHNIYIKEGNYDIGYHAGKIMGAFILSLIFIKLIRLWITFNRRKSLKMKLMKRYTESKNEILRMIEKYIFNLRIYFPISLIVIILICFYISVVCAVYIYSHKYLIVNWIICIIFHIAYSLILNIIPTLLRYLSLKENNSKKRAIYTASRIISYFL